MIIACILGVIIGIDLALFILAAITINRTTKE